MSKAIEVTIQGLVIAARWGQNGTVSAVDIAGYDEQRYRVADDLMGERVRLFTHKRVIADGVITTENHRKTIKVRRFQVVNRDLVLPQDENDRQDIPRE